MKYRAGSLKVLCAWMMILLPSLDAAHVPKKPAAVVSCRLKELTTLTKSLIEASLTSFDKANGENLGNWSGGFPELHVQKNTSLIPSKVQCCLHFVAQGLGKVLEDQRSNLNPTDYSLHEKLGDAISHINMLAKCAKHILGGECSHRPPTPEMPEYAFQRKQWSHTLLKAAGDYLNWLEQKFEVHISNVKETNNIKHKNIKGVLQKYLEGSEHLL
ncbi:uncharacterized protein LOC108872961 [Lates calcarifer]|uniref:Uncharacterized protein LOC108872961 n=1 Tax=Lates calcarifer TaxID=8187 RepID=A0AAJ7L997_LATCA|nr:uncharacterized protein LOC108872961 [Lates calcarifer]